jgi:hypothetical protein
MNNSNVESSTQPTLNKGCVVGSLSSVEIVSIGTFISSLKIPLNESIYFPRFKRKYKKGANWRDILRAENFKCLTGVPPDCMIYRKSNGEGQTKKEAVYYFLEEYWANDGFSKVVYFEPNRNLNYLSVWGRV